MRPVGVWSKHCNELKTQPDIALPLLEPLKADEAIYVQDSVANWLNDVGKYKPDWVLALCKQWEDQNLYTKRIISRALRNLTS